MQRDETSDAIRALLRRVSVVDVDDSGLQQLLTLQGLKSERIRNVVRSQPFGFSSVPPAGAEGLLAPQGGRSDRAHAFNLEHPDYRPRNTPLGGTVIYDAFGDAISIVEKNIRIVCGDTLTIAAPNVVFQSESVKFGTNATKPAAMQGTVDTAGNTDVDKLSTIVLME